MNQATQQLPWRDFSRQQISGMSWPAYSWLVDHHGSGCWNQSTDTVHWRVSDREWTFLLLKFPDITESGQ